MFSTQHGQELKRLLALGGPIMLAQLFQMGMGVIDTVMAGRYSSVDLAGVSIAGSIWFPIMILVMGLLNAITPMVAQLHGSGAAIPIGNVVRQGIWTAIIISLVALLLIQQMDWVMGFINTEDAVREVGIGYLNAIGWGLPGLALYFVLRFAAEGMGKTRPAMVISGVLLIANGFLNYAFIYGHFGAPELGGVGCGVATAIILWLELIGMAIFIAMPYFRRIRIFTGSWRPDTAVFAEFVRVGAPIGATTFFEVAIYSLVTILLASFGAQTVAAHAVAMNFNGVTFMVPMSLAMAATIRVGHCVGAENYPGARIAGQVTFVATLFFATLVAVALAMFRYEIAGLYTEESEVIEIAATVLLFVAGYQYVDDTQVTAIGTLRGYKDTRVPMVLALIGYWIVGIPIAILFGYGYLGLPEWGIYGFWCGLTAGLAFVAVTANVRRVGLAEDEDRIQALAGS